MLVGYAALVLVGNLAWLVLSNVLTPPSDLGRLGLLEWGQSTFLSGLTFFTISFLTSAMQYYVFKSVPYRLFLCAAPSSCK